MESSSRPKMDLEWLKRNTVSVTKKGWHLLRDHRIAIVKDGEVKITGRWDGSIQDNKK